MSPRELERRAKHKLAVLRHVEEVSGKRRRHLPLPRASAGSATTYGGDDSTKKESTV